MVGSGKLNIIMAKKPDFVYQDDVDWGQAMVAPEVKPALWVKAPARKKKHHDLKPEERLRGAKNGGRARASVLSPERRREIAQKAGKARHGL